MKVLISDKIHEKSILFLTDNQIDYDYNPEITSGELLERISGYEGLIVRSRTKVTAEVIVKGTKLKVIGRVGAGVDNIDLEEAKRCQLTVVNAPDANSQAVAEHAIGLMLSLIRNYPMAFSSMKKGQWLKNELSGFELSGKTVGIIGYGNIGAKVDYLVKAFNGRTLIYSRSYQTATLEEVFANADIVTLHVSLNEKTRGMVSAELLGKMKQGAYMINTSRGEVIEEEALYKCLKEGKITGAALDVFWQEPLSADSRWRTLGNVILTPHISASTKEALVRASGTVMKDVIKSLKGEKPDNVVE